MDSMRAKFILERLIRACKSIFNHNPGAARPAALVIGAWGEQQAEIYLRKAGFKILHRRLRIGRRDELDFVARDGQVLVFVEVKTRSDEEFARPFAAINHRKRRALSRAAIRYLRRIKDRNARFRFDVVEVIGRPDKAHRDIRHIRNAFPLNARYRVG